MEKIQLIGLFSLICICMLLVACEKEPEYEVVPKEIVVSPVVTVPPSAPVIDIPALKERLKKTRLVIQTEEMAVEKTFGELGIVLRDEAEFYKKYATMLSGGEGEQVKGFELNSYSMQSLIEELGSMYDLPVTEPELLEIVDGDLVWSKGSDGRSVDVWLTLERVKGAVSRFSGSDIVVNAVVKDLKPILSEPVLDACDSVRGECVVPCDFETDSGKNALRAVELIGDVVLYPGEEFSVKAVLAPFTEEHGYISSTGFLEGIVVDSVGGGVCRVVTALYGAVLRADAEVIERHCHTKRVSYANISMDATVSSEKDFKFQNNTKAPLVISARTTDKGIKMVLYGEVNEELIDCEVVFDAVITDEVPQSSDEVYVSKDVPFYEYRIIEKGVPGCRAALYKYVYKSGEIISSELVNNSLYLPRGSIVLAGMHYK